MLLVLRHLFVSIGRNGGRISNCRWTSSVPGFKARNIRNSVMELPFFGWVDNLPEPVRPVAMGAIKGLASAAINAKVDFSVDLRWGEGGYDGVKMLQARAPSQPPILVHPVTGEPHWFCNVHSHSSKLRKDRDAIYVPNASRMEHHR